MQTMTGARKVDSQTRMVGFDRDLSAILCANDHEPRERARLVCTDGPEPDDEVRSGGVAVVPKGLWHDVEIPDPCHFAYLTPGHSNEGEPLK